MTNIRMEIGIMNKKQISEEIYRLECKLKNKEQITEEEIKFLLKYAKQLLKLSDYLTS